MRESSSKLRENENNFDISLYPLDLSKLHENILKYYRLNLFKEISKASYESPQIFATVSSFKLVNAAYFYFICGVARILVDFLLDCKPEHDNKEDYSLGNEVAKC